MKTLVLGGAGMLGHKIVQTLHAQGRPVECTIRGVRSESPIGKIDFFRDVEVHERINATDLPTLRSRLSEIRPEVLINCIGVIKQRDQASAAIPSITVNSLLPHLLSEWAESWGGRVLHFSTDCVFSGRQGDYTIDDPSDAEDLYGKSKFLGEVQRPNALTLRTSIIGRELSHFASLVEWFLAQQGQTIGGYTRAVYSGMTTQTMADLVVAVVDAGAGLHGLHQVVSAKITKYELLIALRTAYELDVEIKPDDHLFCDRSMMSSGLAEQVGFVVPSWSEQVTRLASDPTPYGDWR